MDNETSYLLRRKPSSARGFSQRVKRARETLATFGEAGNAAHGLQVAGGLTLVIGDDLFDYMREGEELVLEPFSRLIEENKLMAYKYDGFWRSMDTFRDWQTLEAMVERGDTPWMHRPAAKGQCAAAAVRLP